MINNEVSVVDFSTTPIDNTVYPTNFKDLLLSTIDNPYSPFSDYTSWNSYDEHMGYYTNRLLARLVGSPSELGETGLGKEIEDRFYYSTILDVVHNSIRIPYLVVSDKDYNDGILIQYNPNVFSKINTLTA